MPSRTARLSKKGCGFATPECRAQRDVAVHPRPAPPPPLLAAPRLSTTARGYLEIRWVVRYQDPADRDALARVVPDRRTRGYINEAISLAIPIGHGHPPPERLTAPQPLWQARLAGP